MAKLEDLMTPSELVTSIRDGAGKDEIVRQYKTSEQELAMMLLPLYRRGELTKEEFNNFFQGIPVRHDDETQLPGTPDDISATQPEFEPPTEILGSLSNEASQIENEVQKAVGLKNADEGPEESIVPEPEDTKSVLDLILAKVTSIDIQLSEIEKKLDSR